jgi:hypothetical protein
MPAIRWSGRWTRIAYGRFEVLEFKVNQKELKVNGKTNAKKTAASGNLAKNLAKNSRKSVFAGRP